MERYYAIYCHLIERKQVNRRVIFRSRSEEMVKKKFDDKRSKDKSIQEAGLYRAKDRVCISEYIGYI